LPVTIALFALFTGLAIFAILSLLSYYLNITEVPLLFGVFTFVKDNESMSVLRQQYSSNNQNNYVIQSIRSLPGQLWLYDALPTHRNMIIIQSLDNITYAMKVSQNYSLDIIVYDIEQWERTPELERADPSLSISKGAGIVHQAGYRYGITPDAVTLIDNYKKINWAEIDFLGMQLQRFSQNVTKYSSIANEISSFVRSKNPNVEIFSQLSFRFAGATDMIKVIESVKDIVDGFIIFYSPEPGLCVSTCSPHELNLVLDRINALMRHNNYTI
jgi:hypothetical protein